MKILATAVILLFTIIIPSQTKKIDKLNLLFKQGNYRIVERKCKRAIKKNNLDNNNIYSLYSSLSSYLLEKDLNFIKLFSLSNKTASILDENKIEFSIASIYSINYKEKLETDIAKLKNKNRLDESKKLYESYKKIYNNSANSYDNLAIIETEKTNVYAGEQTVINYAKTYLGIPYVYGGNTRNGFDCSGFTKDVFLNYSLKLPRTAKDQSNYAKSVKFKNIKDGDLLFFGQSKNKITHVGIAIKNRGEELKMIHASSSKGIIISNVTSNTYWFPKFQFAGRIID